jgi:hypothetical protein
VIKDLIAFLNARLDEKRLYAEGLITYGPHDVSGLVGLRAQMLREVEAGRKLITVALESAVMIDGEWGDGHEAAEIADGQCGDHGAKAVKAILGPLAAVWNDHPDYRPEWAP